MKLSVPSLVYAVQNNMAFLALSNLDAAVYQVSGNQKCRIFKKTCFYGERIFINPLSHYQIFFSILLMISDIFVLAELISSLFCS